MRAHASDSAHPGRPRNPAFGVWPALALLPLFASDLTAAKLRKLSSVETSSLPEGFPVRVQKVSSHALRVFSPGFPERIAIPSGRDVPARGEEVLATSDGGLLLFLPDEGRPYLRAFDPARGSFLDTEPHVFSTPDVGVAMGKSAVAAFVAEGKASWMKPPRRLSLDVVAFDGGAYRVTRRWESTELTRFISADMNDRGDVVALVARCSLETDIRPKLRYDRYTLLLARADGSMVHNELPSATMDATVALSEGGLCVALYMSQNSVGVVRLFETEKLEPKGEDRTLSGDIPGRQLVARALAVHDEGAVAAAIYVWHSSPPADLALVFVSPGGSCQSVAQYTWNADSIDLAFFGDQSLYIGTTPAWDGEPATAEVYRYEE